MDSYEFLQAQVDEAIQRRINKTAAMIYDWLHENQVTHRKAWAERSPEDQKQYLDLAKRIVDEVL